MRAKHFITETALADLEHHLPRHLTHGHQALVKLVHKIAVRHNMTDDALQNMFKRKHKTQLTDLLKDHLHEEGDDTSDEQTRDFIKWSIETLHIQQPYPKITLSKDADKAQQGRHTGLNIPTQNKIWIYIGNRNRVDVFRTIFHELVHARQYQMGMIKGGESYPGSPIEVLADAMAGKYIKIYGKEHPEIFQ
jgi:hypothetical protein